MLSARTFFQINPEQTVKLHNEVKKAASLTGKEKVADAYCGAGTIGLWLADQAGEIRGMDIIPESKDAKKKDIAVLDPEYRVEYLQPGYMFQQTVHGIS